MALDICTRMPYITIIDNGNAPTRKDATMTTAEIREYLMGRYGVETDCVKTGAEASEDEAGLYEGEGDAWLVNGQMPNSIESGWFFAGYANDIIKDMRSENDPRPTRPSAQASRAYS